MTESMNHQATVNSSYRWQVAFMAAFILFWALYFLYDGYVGYPYKRQVAQEFAKFQDSDSKEEWVDYARDIGLTVGSNENTGHDYSDWDIRTQKIIGYLLMPWTLLMWVSLLRLTGRRIESDGDGITASWGPRVDYDAITSLNLNRWRSKGIAVLHYNDTAGKTRRFVLDNFKYTRNAINDMVEEIESRLDSSQIISNSPRPPAKDENISA